MKTRTIRALALLVTLSAICISCEKATGPAVKGDGVLFSGGIGRSESGTKTSYAGDNAADRTKPEGINWSEGDKVRIWCAECSEPTTETYGGMDHLADYTVTPGAKKRGSLTVEPNTVGLRWGEAETTHHFYAVYPSPKTTGKGDEGKFGTGSSFTFTGHIPAEQGIASYTAGDLSVAAPDMSSLYMVSKADAKPEYSGEGVFLGFTPLTTAIEFTITNGLSDDKVMQVKSVSLESAGHKLCGAFVVDQSGTWAKPVSKKYSGTHSAIYTYANDYPNCAEPEDKSGQGNKVTINLANTAACTSGIGNGKTLRFTFFLLPLTPSEDGTVDDVDDLYLTIERTDKSLKTKLSMADGDPLPFPTHEKTYVTGIIVPDGAGESLNFTATVAEWGDSEYSQGIPMTKKTLPPGALPGEFSVSATKQVHFSRGNLTYNVSTKTWAFYDHQYDYASRYEANLISLFTWGYDAKKSIKPNGTDYVIRTSGNLSQEEDWGCTIGDGKTWRTLSKDEWVYLFNTRIVNSGTGEGKSYQFASINSGATLGIILYPDDYTSQTSATSYTGTEWAAMEQAGCVFLPVAGSRSISTTRNIGTYGCYWSSSAESSGIAYGLIFYSGHVNPQIFDNCSVGYSVRLITESE